MRYLGWALIIFAVSGCSKFEAGFASLNLDASLFRSGDGSLRPSTDQLSEDCLQNSTFNACLYFKNPVAQEANGLSSTQLSEVQKYGIRLKGLSQSGSLENTYVRVLALHTPRFSVMNPSHFRPVFQENGSLVEQLSAYYWANLTLEYLKTHMGSEYLPSQRIEIYADDVFTGIVSRDHSVHLRRQAGEIPKAVQADVVIHLLGQALAHSLSSRQLFGATPNHSPCPSSAGCSAALAQAFGDYLAAMVFPDDPVLGETVAQSASGQSLCGLKRDLNTLKEKSKQEVYAACAVGGNPALMGAWYASIWWSVRAQAGANASLVDKIFFEHARAWTETWTFTSAKAEALRVAQEKFGGQLHPELSSAFAQAGL